jgi:pyrroloquinoline quinone (PQQ) biosynthesis protein C
MEQLVELGGALGIVPMKMAMSRPDPATRAVQVWLRHHLANRSLHIAAQVSKALVEAMSPETGTYLAEGAARHLGLKATQLGYLKIGMKSRQRGDRYAANLLTQIAMDAWHSVEEQTLQVNRLMVRIYDGIGSIPSTM